MTCAYNLNGLIDINTDVADGNGNYWYCDELVGWDAAENRDTLLNRINAHGQIPADLRYNARLLTFAGGVTLCPTDAARDLAMDALSAAADLVDRYGLITVSEAVPKVAVVVRSKLQAARRGGAVIGPHGALFPFGWQLDLYAPDGRKYQATTSSAALGATATNAGNFPALPVISLTTGGTDPITLTNSTAGLALTLHAQAGQPAMPATLTLDFAAHTIIDGSGNNRYDLRDLTTKWWSLEPGANALTVTGGASGTAVWSNTWI
jgi:hypothetical protein